MLESQDLRALIAGDKDAWDRFVVAAAPLLYSAARRTLARAGRESEAEDVAQEVLLKICRQDYRLLRRFDPGRAKLSTWLAVITSSTAIDHLRRAARTPLALDELPEDAAVADPPAERLILPRNILTPRQAAVMALLYDRQLDVADVARLLAITPQSVRSLHHKAVERLRRYFRDRGEDA